MIQPGSECESEVQMEKIVFTGNEGEEILFYVVEETRVNGVNYLLVSETEEEDGDCYIMKDTSSAEEKEAVYEFVEDDETLEALSGLFKALLPDTDIQ